MRIRKLFIGCMSVLLMLSLLCGCKYTDKSISNVTKNEKKISFAWWGNDNRHIYTMDSVDSFMELNSDISVDLRYGEWSGFEKRNRVWMESGNAADVMQINYAWLKEYSPDGEGYYDLYELADIIDLSSYSKEDLSFGEVDGHLNAIPIAFNMSVIYHNKDLYDSYGLSIPTTWEDYFDAAKVMGKDGIYPLGSTKKHIFLLMIAYYEQTYGKTFFDKEGNIAVTQEEMVALLEFYCSLLEEKVLMPIDQFDRSSFTLEKVASSGFWISDSSTYCDELDSKGIELVYGNYPQIKNAKLSGKYMKPATMYAINKNSKNATDSAKLLDFLVNSKEMALAQSTEKGVPISKNAVGYLEENGDLNTREYEATQKMMSQRDEISIMIPNMENDDIINAFKSEADEYYYDKKTIEDAAKGIIEALSK